MRYAVHGFQWLDRVGVGDAMQAALRRFKTVGDGPPALCLAGSAS